MTDITFDFIASELTEKLKGLGKLGIKAKLVFEGSGTLYIDTCEHTPSISVEQNESHVADITVRAPMQVWMEIRSNKLKPQRALLMRKMRIEGDILRGMRFLPHIANVLNS